jgi:hypothetical protein
MAKQDKTGSAGCSWNTDMQAGVWVQKNSSKMHAFISRGEQPPRHPRPLLRSGMLAPILIVAGGSSAMLIALKKCERRLGFMGRRI